MGLVWDLAFLAVGLVLLFIGGEGLVKGATSIAIRFGLSRLIVGLVIVGFGTSAPELLVSIQAALAGSPDIAIGNVVGSNIANILLILGVAAVIAPIANTDTSIRRDLVVMVAASLLIGALFLFGTIDRVMGIGLFAALGVYLVVSYGLERRRRKAVQVELREEAPGLAPLPAGLFVVAGIVMLVLGARFMVDGATGIARDLGISEAVIGLTIVAIGTSLPELATAIVAARKREAEVVLANVVGSNIFNILCILGITAIISPIPVADRFASVDGPIMIAVAAAAALYLYRVTIVGRGVGAALLLAYAGYVAVQNTV
ncbi:calcium/sodium antiporter [Fulvimarina sp. 2208YS6-2-32]|uniref:Calcium/sodium antiporter n=1 Tax=Fulvimarina uroteuthidis TaxID=3098149 RepID=A0ABU5HWS7_9HYPH|nr:calcium/sodium antiporter [Fulvimarina sp. 2208YS6-2-32]MDY8107596.1 calcium/sodium antiporter [Fulvimarina sp. 2208YS6-2-32]